MTLLSGFVLLVQLVGFIWFWRLGKLFGDRLLKQSRVSVIAMAALAVAAGYLTILMGGPLLPFYLVQTTGLLCAAVAGGLIFR